ncbi:MAG TPA: isoprenylcysteine carboxylmethyltransferase family protein [Candidatus Binatia bacterium]|nr:isoprenylcysteine carboxylmethyltransferase family protein [Candidatus Binatia bacterium]
MRLPYNRGGLRSYLIAIGLLAGHATPRSIVCGIPILLVGIALHLWAKGCLHQEKEVTLGGPYRFVRHPFYLGNAFLDLGIAVMSGWWLLQVALPAWWLVIYYRAMRQEEARMIGLFGDAYRGYRERVPLLIPHRRPLPAAPNGFSWHNGNLRRTEIPRAFRFLSYPLMFVLSYRIHSNGMAVVVAPTLLDVTVASACAAMLAIGWALRQHFKHSRAILPPWMIGSTFRFAMLLAVILVGTFITRFELEAAMVTWPAGAAALGISAVLRATRRQEPAVAEALLAVGLMTLFELQWIALLLLPLYAAIVLDGRLPGERRGAPGLSTSRALASAGAYGFAFACGLALSVIKEIWL